MDITEILLPSGHPNRPGFAIAPRGIVWHRTGRDVGALWLGAYFGRTPPDPFDPDAWRYGSAHYGVDDDGAVRYIPEDEGAYHAASARPAIAYSRNGVDLGVELCQYFDDPPRIRPRTYAHAVALAADLCARYGWAGPREIDAVGTARFTRHQDWDPIDRPGDPGDFLRWDDFRDDVERAIAGVLWTPKETRMTGEQLAAILAKNDAQTDAILIYLARLQRGLDVVTGAPLDPADRTDPAAAVLAARG